MALYVLIFNIVDVIILYLCMYSTNNLSDIFCVLFIHLTQMSTVSEESLLFTTWLPMYALDDLAIY